jgi:ATP-dependent protease ClpP protease subunit
MNKCPENRIHLFERITAEKVDTLIDEIGKLMQAGITEAELLINCRGGAVSAALNLYDVIIASGIKWKGIVIADCLSSAVTVLQACQERKAFPNASFLIHNTSREFKVRLDKSQSLEYFQARLAEDYKQTSAMDSRNEKALTEHIKPAHLEEFKKLYISGEHFFPEEALEIGLIDEIVTKA